MGVNLSAYNINSLLELTKKKQIIPAELSIETVFGCNAKVPSDFLEGQFKLGNVNDMSPIEALKSAAYLKIRKLHLMNEKNGMSLCNSCTILYSNSNRGWNWKEFDDKGGLDRSEKNNYMKL